MHEYEPPPASPQPESANLYAPPKAAVTSQVSVESVPEFYVVAPWKCMLLFFGTVGLYHLYWFWKHWALQRDRHRLSIWPIPRALFSIFFAHALNSRVDEQLARRGVAYRWSPGGWATLYVIGSIVSRILDQLVMKGIGWPTTDVLSLLILLPIGLSLLQAQRAANMACADPAGAGNRRLTTANGIWLFFFGLFWLLILLGIGISPEELA